MVIYSIPYDTITYNMSHNMSYITSNFTDWPPLCPSGCCCAGAHSNHPHAPPCDAWWSLLLVAWPQTHAPSSWPQPQPLKPFLAGPSRGTVILRKTTLSLPLLADFSARRTLKNRKARQHTPGIGPGHNSPVVVQATHCEPTKHYMVLYSMLYYMLYVMVLYNMLYSMLYSMLYVMVLYSMLYSILYRHTVI